MTPKADVWKAPPAELTLSRDDVHVWRAPLDVPAGTLRRLQQSLGVDELERAARFHAVKNRRRFVAGRGILRAILARYQGCEPHQVRFRYGEHGKPFLEGLPREALRFNLAHSGGLVVYAVTREREVGIDLEYVRANVDVERIVDRFFSPHEIAAFRALPAGLRREAFFNGWTRKEAYLKARGEGLSLPLDRFDVSLAPGEPAALLDVRDEDARRWSLRALDPGPAYKAALVVDGRAWRLSCWQWSGEPPGAGTEKMMDET